MIDLKKPEIQFALDAVRQASLLVRQVQLEMVTANLTKVDSSPVTVADFASQALVAHLLDAAFPEDPLVAEEDAHSLRASNQQDLLARVTGYVGRFRPDANPEAVCDWIDRGQAQPASRFWTLDPIDGTKGYLRGDQYAIALALVEDGQVQIGVLGCPNLSDGYRPDFEGPGSLVIAARGEGSWTTSLAQAHDFDRLHVSDRSISSLARMLRSFESGHTNVDQIDRLAEVMGVQVQPIRMDSQAKYAILAAGKGDVLLRLLSPDRPDYREKIWDQAAGSLVVEEAGGQVTDIRGKALDFSAGKELVNNQGVVATNCFLHPAVLSALNTVLNE
ncbi:MAG: 3'(2'),5'-bisphosphate nucleotidase [Chloroflexota bacterium]|nr:MAG: 3'(2'),5'-bisphosphate nucleotidase [Chloroflexota bacterium]